MNIRSSNVTLLDVFVEFRDGIYFAVSFGCLLSSLVGY